MMDQIKRQLALILVEEDHVKVVEMGCIRIVAVSLVNESFTEPSGNRMYKRINLLSDFFDDPKR